jgi:hypothetical protein
MGAGGFSFFVRVPAPGVLFEIQLILKPFLLSEVHARISIEYRVWGRG